jgi:hypothetical protein
MTESLRRGDDLTTEEVFKVAAALDCGDAIIVGGQALNIWAERFSARAPELAAYRPFTSRDFDYFGYREVAGKLAERLGGTIKVPTIEDQSPSTALVEAEINGRRITIDFIGHVLGVNHKKLQTGAVQLRIPFTFGEGTHELTLDLLHPVHCLQARVANVITLRRRDAASLRQMRTAVIVTREYILDRLEAGDIDEATWTVKQLFGWMRSSEGARVVHTEVGIDPLEILKRTIDAPQWDERYRRLTIAPMIDRVEGKRRC